MTERIESEFQTLGEQHVGNVDESESGNEESQLKLTSSRPFTIRITTQRISSVFQTLQHRSGNSISAM